MLTCRARGEAPRQATTVCRHTGAVRQRRCIGSRLAKVDSYIEDDSMAGQKGKRDGEWSAVGAPPRSERVEGVVVVKRILLVFLCLCTTMTGVVVACLVVSKGERAQLARLKAANP